MCVARYILDTIGILIKTLKTMFRPEYYISFVAQHAHVLAKPSCTYFCWKMRNGLHSSSVWQSFVLDTIRSLIKTLKSWWLVPSAYLMRVPEFRDVLCVAYFYDTVLCHHRALAVWRCQSRVTDWLISPWPSSTDLVHRRPPLTQAGGSGAKPFFYFLPL